MDGTDAGRPDRRQDDARALATALTVWLRAEMIAHLDHELMPPPLLWDMGQSNYEFGCMALHWVGAVEEESKLWRVLGSAMDVPALPAKFGRTHLDWLLDALVRHLDHTHRVAEWCDGVRPRDGALDLVCRAMMRAGYMRPAAGGVYEWHDRFGPWLVRHEARSLDDYRPAAAPKVARALALIPDDEIAFLARTADGQSEFVRYFLLIWHDDGYDPSGRRGVPHDDLDIPLAAGLHRRLRRG